MKKGYIYIVSDGIGDIFKFGYTTEPLARITKYNSTECFRPVKYDSLVEYSTEREARDVEIEIRNSLTRFIKNAKSKPEVAEDCVESRDVYNSIISRSNFVDINLSDLYNRIFNSAIDNINYEHVVQSIVDKAKNIGKDEVSIYESIVKNLVGYKFENASPIVIKENRRKNLIRVNNTNLYYDTKPKLIERFCRLALLDYELETNVFID
jgi:hypothetical protein